MRDFVGKTKETLQKILQFQLPLLGHSLYVGSTKIRGVCEARDGSAGETKTQFPMKFLNI